MKKIMLLLLIVSPFLFAGCEKGEMGTDFDPDTDFSKFKTYSWKDFEDGKTPLEENFPKLNNGIIEAVESELQSKGLEKAEEGKGELQIAYKVKVRIIKKKEPAAKYDTWENYGNTGPWCWECHAIPAAAEDTQYSDIKEGTFMLNMVNASNDKLVWQGWVIGEFRNANIPKKNVKKRVKELFRSFPPGK